MSFTHLKTTLLRIRRLAFVLLLIVSSGSTAIAQLTRGFISGTVTDTTEAIIAGAQVTIKNKATNLSRTAETNAAGVYRFAGVEPGTYSIQFAMQGFNTYTIDDVEVSTAQEVTLNQALSVGGVSSEVLVLDTPGLEVQKSTATIERTFSQRVIHELPFPASARDVTRIALLAPTAIRAPGSSEFSVNGQRARNNNFTLDGVDNNDFTITIHATRMIPEAFQEIQVQATAYSAEFGRNSGAQFSAITRRGTNRFHSSLWDYNRGSWAEPLSLVNKRAGLKETPGFVANQFGGDIEGPIVRNRTFFFGLIEANRRRESPDARNASSVTIPTPAGYSALANTPLGSPPVRPTQQNQASRQQALSALSFLPEIHRLVTTYDNRRDVIVNNFPIEVGTIRIPIARPHNFFYNVLRLDHQLTERETLSYRYYIDQREQPDLVGNTGFGTRWTATQSILAQNHAISHTLSMGSNLLNELRLAYVRRRLNFPERDPNSPTVSITGFFTIGGSNAFPQGRIDNTYQLQNVSSYMAGRNAFKIGADVRHYALSSRSGMDSKGTWSFSSFADFLNNNATSFQQAVNEVSFNSTQWNHAYFFQDDIKATRNLTVNLGIRYENSTVPLGLFGATDPQIGSAGVPGPARRDKNNWGPRFGFAFSPGKTSGLSSILFGENESSIRGGFGVGYDVIFYNIISTTAGNYPRVVNSRYTQPATTDLFPQLAPKVPSLAAFSPLLAFANAAEDIQNPTTHFWSLSAQRELGPNHVIEIGYTGNRSYHGIRQSQSNPAVLTPQQAATVLAGGTIPSVQERRLNPAWGQRIVIESSAKGEYHAGYLKFDRRTSRGLLVGANYTWSANFSDNDEGFGQAEITDYSPQVPQDFFNYQKDWSRSAFDRPHRLAIHYIYEIPWFSAAGANTPIARQIFRGWQASGMLEYQSGQPFTIRTGVDTTGTALGNPPGRPNYNPGGILTEDPDTHDLRTFAIPLNATGIVTVPSYAVNPGSIIPNTMSGGGNLGRNTFRGPSFQNWNLSLMKRFSIGDSCELQLRGDFNNVWNHNNFQSPDARMSSPTFGLNTATPLTDSREVLLSLKLQF